MACQVVASELKHVSKEYIQLFDNCIKNSWLIFLFFSFIKPVNPSTFLVNKFLYFVNIIVKLSWTFDEDDLYDL